MEENLPIIREYPWEGKFKSSTYPSLIYGSLKTMLRSPEQTGYTTVVNVSFQGLGSLAAPFFSKYMNPSVSVCVGNKFVTRVGKADVVFTIDSPLTASTEVIHGKYTSEVKEHGYVSNGSFMLKKKV